MHVFINEIIIVMLNRSKTQAFTVITQRNMCRLMRGGGEEMGLRRSGVFFQLSILFYLYYK